MKTLPLALWICSHIVLAQGTSSGLSQLKIPGTARLASLGESLVAEPGEASSLAANPANLYRIARLALHLTHNEWIHDLRAEQLLVSYPFWFATIGIGVSSTSIGNIEIRERPGPAQATFTARSAALQVSLATPIREEMVVGASSRLLYEKMYVEEATGVAVDLGILYHLPVEGLVAGLSVSNLGGTSALAEEDIELPRRASFGISYRMMLPDLNIVAFSQLTTERAATSSRISAGVEGTFLETLSLRLGYQSGYDTRSLSTGMGVHVGILSLDYAFVPFSYNLGSGHLFTIGLTP